MFYLRHKGERMPILSDNVFTTCPVCGREHAVDLQEVLIDGDLVSSLVYCPACAVADAERILARFEVEA